MMILLQIIRWDGAEKKRNVKMARVEDPIINLTPVAKLRPLKIQIANISRPQFSKLELCLIPKLQMLLIRLKS